MDRFRSLPVWRPAPLVGALLGDSVRYVLAVTVIIVLGVALGYRPDAGVTGAVSALLLRSPNAVMNAGFMAIFPLTFLANVFVQPATLPGPLRAFVDVNPISLVATASRGLMDGTASPGQVAAALAVAAGLTLVFVPVTSLLYRRG